MTSTPQETQPVPKSRETSGGSGAPDGENGYASNGAGPESRGPRPENEADASSDPPIGQMGRIVGSGMALMVVATVTTKLMSMAAQWVLGAKLSAEDFAVFAYATAIAGFTMICREAGIRELLVQRGEKHYEGLAGTGFWFALSWNVFVSAIMAAIALPLAHLLKQPLLAPMLWVIAAALPIGTVGGILQTSMRLHLRFSEFAANTLTGSFARQLSTIVLALSGVGAMSLAWPVMVSTVVEAVGAFVRTRDALWKRKPEPARWPGLLRDSKWLMFASVANFAVDWGPFLVMAIITALSQVQSGPLLGIARAFSLTNREAGLFYFAFMITAQVGVLLSFNLALVLTPALARLNDDPARMASGVLRSLRTLMLAGSIGSLGLACVIDPLQHLLWPPEKGELVGKWQAAVPAVIILGAFFPWRITFGVSASMLQAQGRFRLYALLTAIEGGGLTIFTITGALVHPSATMMAWWAGGWLLISRCVLTLWVLRSIGVRAWEVIRSTFPAWLCAVVSAGCGLATIRLPWAGWIGPAHPRVVDGVSVLVAGGTCVIVFALLCRVMLRSHLEEALAVTPARLRTIVARLMLMPVPD